MKIDSKFDTDIYGEKILDSMPERSQIFTIEEEQEASVKTHSTSCNVVLLCIIAPFTPLRVAPERELFAQFTFPDEFVIEEFIDRVDERYTQNVAIDHHYTYSSIVPGEQ